MKRWFDVEDRVTCTQLYILNQASLVEPPASNTPDVFEMFHQWVVSVIRIVEALGTPYSHKFNVYDYKNGGTYDERDPKAVVRVWLRCLESLNESLDAILLDETLRGKSKFQRDAVEQGAPELEPRPSPIVLRPRKTVGEQIEESLSRLQALIPNWQGQLFQDEVKKLTSIVQIGRSYRFVMELAELAKKQSPRDATLHEQEIRSVVARIEHTSAEMHFYG